MVASSINLYGFAQVHFFCSVVTFEDSSVEQIEILILLESNDAGFLDAGGGFGDALAEVVIQFADRDLVVFVPVRFLVAQDTGQRLLTSCFHWGCLDLSAEDTENAEIENEFFHDFIKRNTIGTSFLILFFDLHYYHSFVNSIL